MLLINDSYLIRNNLLVNEVLYLYFNNYKNNILKNNKVYILIIVL